MSNVIIIGAGAAGMMAAYAASAAGHNVTIIEKRMKNAVRRFILPVKAAVILLIIVKPVIFLKRL